MTLGSLFDGSGGFPLAGTLSGITPIWASEVEPYPIAVTRSRFPRMEHLGSVTDIDGGKICPVDVVTFGSPCQDMSIAGKRAGIHAGQKSNLFFEAVRVIKEMRRATNGKYPKFAVWENVPGAFSSSWGEDFRCVLEAFAGIFEEGVSIPRPKKWGGAGEIVGDGYSVAWRTLDAQYWGVPQRRKRIYLVADFRGERAGEILFEREGVRGHTETGGEAWQYIADDNARDAGRNVCIKFYDARGNGDGAHCTTLTGAHESHISDYTTLVFFYVSSKRKWIVRRLTPLECCRLQGCPDGWGVPAYKDGMPDDELAFWQCVRDTYAKVKGKSAKQYKLDAMLKWYNSLHTDSSEYKMWGNGIALPCAAFVLRGVAEQLAQEERAK